MSTLEAQAAVWFYTQPVLNTQEDTGAVITSLVAEYATMLYRVAFSVTRNAAEAEDIVQDTFLRVLRHQEKVREIRDPRVWLVRIAWNLALDRKRRAKTRPETEDLDDHARQLTATERLAEDEVISSQECARILDLIDRLPDKERQALLLSAVEELSTAEIASICSTTESSIRSRIFRARKELALLLARERGGQ
ncbi:RNA polymerase sigma factor [Pseudacidobacterium ailaaui]|jgi:RNA polymerase sigma-70 factor (ECF subfamily)|uniref:RNA polymerase sigma factor n=1 Tax=Pseudacidobacterium ailaaui TaxID=1382359 RepID=UPI0005D1A4A8|nr:RNA polymerase sigma factor [Pseudacidobacterium ailaaui]MCL6463328.1 RNA polymerase sigma factor [Pseudacidobacterium ailaaui]